MRILHLLASPFWSGPAENVAYLALAQRALGHDVTVAVDRLRTTVAAEEPIVPRLAALGLLSDVPLELSVKSSPWRTWADTRLLAKQRIDLVHSHFTHDHLVARWGRPRGAKLVRSLHAARSLRRSLPFADAYTLPSMALRHALTGRRVMLLPPLVGPEFVPPVDRRALQTTLGLDGSPVVGMVSTFQPSRRHDLGVEAFARLVEARPEARLVLVGDGALEADVRENVRKRGLSERVTFAGYQSGEAFAAWLSALDVVWILGLGNDGSGRAAAQARASDVAVVAVDEGGLALNADTVVEPDAKEIVEATLTGDRRIVAARLPVDIARDVLRLYEGS